MSASQNLIPKSITRQSRLGLKPEECLIVEDNQNGIKAAQASGANVMIVNSVEDVNYTNIKANIKKFESVEV